MSSVMNHTELDSLMGTHAEFSHTSQMRRAFLLPVIQRPGPRGAPRVLFSALHGKSRQLPLLLPATSPELSSARSSPGCGPAPPPGARSPQLCS